MRFSKNGLVNQENQKSMRESIYLFNSLDTNKPVFLSDLSVFCFFLRNIKIKFDKTT